MSSSPSLPPSLSHLTSLYNTLHRRISYISSLLYDNPSPPPCHQRLSLLQSLLSSYGTLIDEIHNAERRKKNKENSEENEEGGGGEEEENSESSTESVFSFVSRHRRLFDAFGRQLRSLIIREEINAEERGRVGSGGNSHIEEDIDDFGPNDRPLPSSSLSASEALRRRLFAKSPSTSSSSPPPSSSSSSSLSSSSASVLQQRFDESAEHTRKLLLNSLESSESALRRLQISTSSVQSVTSELGNFNVSLRVGNRIIKTQERREKTDKIFLVCGILFFLCCVGYIVNKRLRITRTLLGW